MADFLCDHTRSSANNKIEEIIDRLNNYLGEMNTFNTKDLTEVVNEIAKETDVQLQSSTDRKQFREVYKLLLMFETSTNFIILFRISWHFRSNKIGPLASMKN